MMSPPPRAAQRGVLLQVHKNKIDEKYRGNLYFLNRSQNSCILSKIASFNMSQHDFLNGQDYCLTSQWISVKLVRTSLETIIASGWEPARFSLYTSTDQHYDQRHHRLS